MNTLRKNGIIYQEKIHTIGKTMCIIKKHTIFTNRNSLFKNLKFLICRRVPKAHLDVRNMNGEKEKMVVYV
jgi:hypothetical protein